MCRKVAGEMEGCAPEPEEEDSGGVIQISRAGLEFILRDLLQSVEHQQLLEAILTQYC